MQGKHLGRRVHEKEGVAYKIQYVNYLQNKSE